MAVQVVYWPSMFNMGRSCAFSQGFLTLLFWPDMPSFTLPFTSHGIGPYTTQANARLWTDVLPGLLSDRQAQGAALKYRGLHRIYTEQFMPAASVAMPRERWSYVPWHSVACLIALDNKIDKLAFMTVGKCSLISQPMSLLCLMFDHKLKVGCSQDIKVQFPL